MQKKIIPAPTFSSFLDLKTNMKGILHKNIINIHVGPSNVTVIEYSSMFIISHYLEN